MEQPLPANHASSRQPGTTCENRGLRTRILSTIKSQPSTFLFLDLPGGSAVFQKDGIIGEARIQPQAALQRNLALGFGVSGLGFRIFLLLPINPVAQTFLSAGSRDILVPRFLLNCTDRRLESRLNPQTGMSALHTVQGRKSEPARDTDFVACSRKRSLSELNIPAPAA
jgi:hypothetical protein